MVFANREMEFCVLEYARTNSNKTVQRAFVRKFSKKSPTAKQIWSWKKKFEDEDCLCRAKGSSTSNSRREGRADSSNTLAKPQKIHKKNKHGDPDTSNDSLAGSKEMFGNETLQIVARSGHNCR